jgi:hypothetical protein
VRPCSSQLVGFDVLGRLVLLRAPELDEPPLEFQLLVLVRPWPQNAVVKRLFEVEDRDAGHPAELVLHVGRQAERW